jgi:hypothetical protein
MDHSGPADHQGAADDASDQLRNEVRSKSAKGSRE